MGEEARKRLWTTAITLALIAGGYFGVRAILAPHRFAPSSGSGAGDLPPGVGVRVERLTFTGFDEKNREVYKLRADVVDAGSDRMRVEARGNVEAELLDATSGKRRAFVTAPNAVFSRASRTLQISGKIVARFPGNDAKEDLRVEAQTLVWNIGTKQVLCSGAVHADLPSGTGTMDGRDVAVNLETRELSAERPRVEFVLKDGGGQAAPALKLPF